MFYVGQKVVCVDDRRHELNFKWTAIIKKNATYTVRWCGVFHRTEDGLEYMGVKLEGIVRGSSDNAYCATRFRPAVERKTSIEIFTRMLNPSKERETVS